MSPVQFPVPKEVFDTHVAILGKTGSGKTVTAKGAVERMLDRGERVCIIDPTGAWWGLRLASDGKTPAYPVVIFGGRHADAPIGKQSGARLAELLGTRNVPAIIDTSMMTVKERTTFLTDFGDTIYRTNDGPLNLIIDEAHTFAPKNKLAGQERMLHAANNLATGGRSRGFRITMITQRPAKLHNDMLAGADSLITMKLTLPHDFAAVRKWIKEFASEAEAKDMLASLPRLTKGEGWIYAPELEVLERVRFPMCETFDSSAAPTAGTVKAKPQTVLDHSDIAELVALLEAPPATPKKGGAGQLPVAHPIFITGNVPVDLPPRQAPTFGKEVAGALLEDAPAMMSAIQDVIGGSKHDVRLAIEGMDAARFARTLERALGKQQTEAHADGVMTGLARAVESISELQRQSSFQSPDAIVLKEGRIPPHEMASLQVRPLKETAPPKPSTPTDADSTILSILAHGPRPWAEVAILTGYAQSGGGFRVARKRLVEAGLVTDGAVARAAVAAAAPSPLPTPAETVALWKRKLGGSAGAVLADLFANGGASTIDAVCARTGYVATGGGFRSALKKLRNNGLLTQTRNALELADVLKPKGKRG